MKKNNLLIICFGELLIDMISTQIGRLENAEGFLKKFGGAPANTAIGLAKLGNVVSFIGKVGHDPFGLYLKNTLESNNVNTKSLILSNVYKTTLAFVSLTKSGERDFTFYKGAHEAIFASDVSLPKSTFLLHFGSLTQTTIQNKKATEKLIAQAHKQKTIISYDPNIRESLWDTLEHAQNVILETAQKVDILKVNEDEAKLLTNTSTIESAGQKLFSPNLDILLITLGSKGCYYKTKKHQGYIGTITVQAIDTTGAGDAFNAGYIDAVCLYGFLSELSQSDLEKALKRATTIAALTTTKKGAISAFPNSAALKKYNHQSI